QRVGGVMVAGNHAAGKAEPRLFVAYIGVLRLRRARSGRTSAQDDRRIGCTGYAGLKPGTTRASAVTILVRQARRRSVDVLGTQAVEQRLLLAGEEAQLQPAEDVIHDGLGVADVLVVAPAAGLEAGVGELVAQQLERHAVLQGERHGAGKAVHEAADGRAFLGHGDEQLTRHAVLVEADGE